MHSITISHLISQPVSAVGTVLVLCAVVTCIAGCGVDCRPEEFTNLSGLSAKQWLDSSWPKAVDANAVESVNFKSLSSRDSYSTWYRIAAKKTAALAWAADAHTNEENWANFLSDMDHYAPEGVKRTVPGLPSLRNQTGTTPSWWSPATIDFRATEIMFWYPDGDSGTARATYSAFDDSNNTLWIYKYSCQHDSLWSRGQLPEGEPIDLIKK